jgi:hypothetical protein
MERTTSVAKTVRIDQELVDKVLEQLQTEERSYHQLNFSEIVKNGLLLVLAAYGQKIQPKSWQEYRRYDSAARIRQTDTLKKAVDDLLALAAREVA